MWSKALPYTLPSFDILVLETYRWFRLRLPAAPALESENLQNFLRFFNFSGFVLFQILFII